jgi:D-alanyl-D-alanine carboxypeptidase
MQLSQSASKKNIYLLRFLVLILIGVTAYALSILNEAKDTYASIGESIAKQPSIAKVARVGDKTVNIPTYEMFRTGNVWALVSKKHPLKGEAGYQLINIPVAHGDEGAPMKIARDIADELETLINTAEADGEPLMISSAYRSLQEQRELYDEFVAKNGREMAAVYVSPVGSSEHHTGLSIDFSSVSDECAEDSDSCSLSQSGAAWLADNAHRFGFIQRYPQGKQDITGVGYEPWHYRFIGVPLATAMAGSGLTYEEVLAEIAPGYAKTR